MSQNVLGVILHTIVERDFWDDYFSSFSSQTRKYVLFILWRVRHACLYEHQNMGQNNNESNNGIGQPPFWSLVSCHFWDLNNQPLSWKTPMTAAVVIGLSVFNFKVLIGKLNHINDGNMMGSHWLQANKFFGQLLDFSVTCHLSLWSLWSGFLEQISGNTERVPILPGRCSSGERSVVSTLTSP